MVGNVALGLGFLHTIINQNLHDKAIARDSLGFDELVERIQDYPLKKVSEICKEYNIKMIIDACRIAENSYFIKEREKKYKKFTYKKIAQKMFDLADGCTMSLKKDGIVNMGGFLALNNNKLAQKCRNELIITEGFITYGGISGRDMEAIVEGLKEVFDADYLKYRVASTMYLGDRLTKMGIPIVLPVGGHAVYIDAKSLYNHIPVDQYPGQSLVCNLYLL